jgi:hypothetical protein
VLAVGVHEDQDLASGISGTGLDRRTVAHAIGMANDLDAVFFAYLDGFIVGTVVYNDDFSVVRNIAQARQ